jgi:hypothetical protein
MTMYVKHIYIFVDFFHINIIVHIVSEARRTRNPRLEHWMCSRPPTCTW